jgi:5-methylcytosine-specific restriction enzyme subunit McrC
LISSPETNSGQTPEFRRETLREAAWAEVDLTLEQQAQLQAIGRRLAKGTDRYGNPIPGSEASLIKVERAIGQQRARVRVLDAVGVIAISGLQLLIEPKIPQAHLLYLAERSGVLPAMATQRAAIKEDQHLVGLVAHWFVASLERLLEEGLSRDYRVERGPQRTVRGRIDPLQTAQMFYRGELGVHCEHEEFDFDTPLNRLLLAAARIVACADPLDPVLRRRAARATRHLYDVGTFRSSDMTATVDRTTAHYGDGITLAKEIIRSSGRALGVGASIGWTFLFRTAAPIESGLRMILKEVLADQMHVAKRAFPLGDSGKTVTPDLVFGDAEAIGDVKYKLCSGDWTRPNLYEVVAFAAAAQVPEAVLVSFLAPGSPPPQSLTFGRISVKGISWPADPNLSPAQAAELFSAAARRWWATTIAGKTVMGAAGFEPATSRV